MVPLRLQRMLYGILGALAVGLAFVGVLVPGMPTTVFVLIAAFCFARSSPQLESWLLRHRWFGAPLRRFRETGGMPWVAKIAALGSMWTAIALSSLVLVAINWKLVLVVLALGIAGSATILFWVRTVPAASKA